MPRKTTVTAPSNIAFIKYWGAEDLEHAIPANPSISMTLRTCHSRSTVEWIDDDGEHEILWRGAAGTLEDAPPAFADRVRGHLDTLRQWSKRGGRFRLATENSFPSAAGMASSASGFAALTLATLGALDLEVSPARQSALARASGSGSAARSVMGGYVEWPAEGDSGEEGVECHARQLVSADHWDLRNVIAVVERGAKATSSLEGHRRARSSPYFDARLQGLARRLRSVRRAIMERDFTRLGEVVEAEAVDLHCIAMTSEPAIFYWQPSTLAVLAAVREMRRDGIEAYSTMDAGANVHVLCEPPSETEVARRLGELDVELSLIHDGVGDGPARDAEHLF